MTATLNVYLRAYTPISKSQDEVVAAARTLDATDRVDDCEFTEWPATVSLDRDVEAVDVYETVTAWGDANDVDVSTPFRLHTRTNPMTDDRESVLHTPVVYLTLEYDGDLAGVAPCTLPDGTHVTAKAFLDALQDERDPYRALATGALVA
ncbi:hypothetical protein G9C85_12415 [Halorubellus sp. JP-L1]|uniref:HTH domain-containing protein n=1 Tax=Halorubellus sp. JP-L1 TaxID=2715753 RepID=UPI001407CAD2|nr:HTH domain-containing protein [Halorubellus sp. JP-L1]NHN42422.1 hypothetical protein [Halorubellus sp. JP-L1]